MSTKMVLLGLLRERPLYGYEIKQLLKERMQDSDRIAFGSIYFALNNLEKQGLIKQVAIEKSGNRPSRSVYQITAEGEKEFFKLLKEVLSRPESFLFAMDLGMSFLHLLPKEEVAECIHFKMLKIDEGIEEIKQTQTETGFKALSAANAVPLHQLYHLEAEKKWLSQLLKI